MQDGTPPVWTPITLRFEIPSGPSTISPFMDTTRIAELLQPLPQHPRSPQVLSFRAKRGICCPQPSPTANISTYIDLLLRWNARINLTAIRQPEEIVTRHFGESLFAARHLFPAEATTEEPSEPALRSVERNSTSVIDVGSGAGFPGIPIKIWAPDIHLTLIESNQKKATFLREVARTLTLTNINVFPGRAEDYPGPPAERSNPTRRRAIRHRPSDRHPPGRTNRPLGPTDRRIPARPHPRPSPLNSPGRRQSQSPSRQVVSFSSESRNHEEHAPNSTTDAGLLCYKKEKWEYATSQLIDLSLVLNRIPGWAARSGKSSQIRLLIFWHRTPPRHPGEMFHVEHNSNL